MAIEVRCTECGKAFQVPDQRAGQRGRCACGAILEVPAGTRRPPESGAPREHREEARPAPGTVECPACGAANPPGYRNCSGCDAPGPGFSSPSTPSRKLSGAASGRGKAVWVALVGVVLLLGGSTTYWYLMMGNPRQVAQRFLEASKSADFKRMKRFLTAASRAEMAKQEAQLEQMQQKLQALAKAPLAEEFRKQAEAMKPRVEIKVTAVTVQGKTATAQYTTSFSGGEGRGGNFDIEQTLHLAREGWAWKVDWIKTQKAQMERFRQEFGDLDLLQLLEQSGPRKPAS